MKLQIKFHQLRFPSAVIRDAISTAEGLSKKKDKGVCSSLSVTKGPEEWEFDELEEFLAQVGEAEDASLCFRVPLDDQSGCEIWMFQHPDSTSVSVSSKSRSVIHTIMNVFKNAGHRAIHVEVRVPADTKEDAKDDQEEELDFSIFIGHGHSSAWKTLKDHLQDKHEIDVIAFESGERAGHVTRDILDEMLDESSLAFLVHTGEDETVAGTLRARQNVVHETGLFQGRLGFSKAIVLLEEGVEKLSNLDGIQYISFPQGHIQSTFGDVVATIARERRRKARR